MVDLGKVHVGQRLEGEATLGDVHRSVVTQSRAAARFARPADPEEVRERQAAAAIVRANRTISAPTIVRDR